MIKVSIAGGTGYTAGELLRILLNHPGVTIESVISSSSAGVPVSSIHRDLFGEMTLPFPARWGSPTSSSLPRSRTIAHLPCREQHSGDMQGDRLGKRFPQRPEVRRASSSSAVRTQPGADQESQQHCQSGLFCHLHHAGAVAVGSIQRADRRDSRTRHHRINRSRQETGGYNAFQLSRQQYLGL